MDWIIIGFGLAIATGCIAQSRGRNGMGWFLLSLICLPLALILVLCLPSPKAQKLEQERRDEDRRRHDQMIALLAANANKA